MFKISYTQDLVQEQLLNDSKNGRNLTQMITFFQQTEDLLIYVSYH